MNYVDKYGFWNVKPVASSCLPSGNDGAIVTAYAQKAGLGIDWPNLWNTRELIEKLRGVPMQRHPGKFYPPPSRDTMLGMVALGLLHPEDLKANGWLFCPFAVPAFNPLKTIAALWRMRKAHRNALWEGTGEPHLFRFAFSVPLVDRSFMLRKVGMPRNFFYDLAEWIGRTFFPPKNDSSKLIAWLKSDFNAPELEVFKRYFGESHPIMAVVTYKLGL